MVVLVFGEEQLLLYLVDGMNNSYNYGDTNDKKLGIRGNRWTPLSPFIVCLNKCFFAAA